MCTLQTPCNSLHHPSSSYCCTWLRLRSRKTVSCQATFFGAQMNSQVVLTHRQLQWYQAVFLFPVLPPAQNLNHSNQDGSVSFRACFNPLKTTVRSAKFENPSAFLCSFSHWHVEGFSSKTARFGYASDVFFFTLACKRIFIKNSARFGYASDVFFFTLACKRIFIKNCQIWLRLWCLLFHTGMWKDFHQKLCQILLRLWWLKGHPLSLRSCPPTRSAPSERFGY